MITFYPEVGDGISHYMFVPMLATLYGRDRPPYRFLRVVDDEDMGGNGRTITQVWNDPQDPDSLCLVETAGLTTFLEFVSYGYTPYLECSFSGYRDGTHLAEAKAQLFTEALLRNYEARVKILIEICENKRYSLAGRSVNSPVTGELIDETWGALAMWEMVMNMGSMKPNDCLSYLPEKRNHLSIPIKRFKEKLAELDERLLISNHVEMPYKMSESQRTAFIRSRGGNR